MASTHKHIRSGTANKRPTTAIADGQIALATNIASPGLFFKDSAGATIVKIGPVHVGATAPNASPAGSAGNSIGEVWLDTSLTPVGVKIYDGSAFVNATPIGSTTVQGLLELATDAETQAGADTARAITSASLQSKLSDSTSTTSNITIASSTAVKAAYDLANAALPKTGGTVTGNLEIGTAGSLTFEGATADGFETTIAITDPTADRTITLPNTTGTVVTTGDSGTVTSTMLLDGTIVDADINANAEISVSKLVDGSARQLLQTDAAGTGVEWASNIDIPGTLDVTSAATFDSTVAVTGALTKSGSNVVTVGDTGTVTSTMILDETILNSDVNASAAIAGTKISPDFGAQTIVTTGVHSAALGAAATPSFTFTGDLNTGIYSPGADQLAVATNGVQRINIEADGDINIDGGGVFYDATNNRLAIGTTSPTGTLNVHTTGTTDVDKELCRWSTASGGILGILVDETQANPTWRFRYANNESLAFVSNTTERMRITSEGYIRFIDTSANASTSGYGATFVQLGTVGSTARTALQQRSETTSSTTIQLYYNPNGQVGSISTSASATVYATSSDYRLKENIAAVTDGITRLQQLKPSRFNFKVDPSHTVDGFIAHEAQAVVPECVTGTKDEVDEDGNPVYQGIDQSKLVPLLTAALQEAIAKIETLEQRLTAAGID